MEPYDDSQPFPPEWEGEQNQGLPPELMAILGKLLGGMGGNLDAMAEECRKEFKELLSKCALVANMGMACFESSTNKPDSYDKGFHGMARWNMDKSVIEAAGLTVAEVDEVWRIHMKELNDFFQAIKNRNIDNGKAIDGNG